jgi:L-lactate dehydrogenase
MALRGSAREIVLVNRNRDRATGTISDLQYGAVLAPTVSLRAGDYSDLRGAAIVMLMREYRGSILQDDQLATFQGSVPR